MEHPAQIELHGALHWSPQHNPPRVTSRQLDYAALGKGGWSRVSTALETLAVKRAPVTEELAGLIADLGRSYAVPEIQDDENRSIRLTMSGDKAIDLSRAPAGRVVHLQVQAQPGTRTLTLTGLGPGSVVTLSIPELPSNEKIELLKLTNCRGQLRLGSLVRGVHLVCADTDTDTEEEPREDQPGDEARSVVLLTDAAITVDEPFSKTMLILRGGTVWVGSSIEEVAIVEQGTIALDKSNSGPIQTLTVGGDSLLTLGPDRPLIGVIRGLVDPTGDQHRRPKLRLQPQPARGNVIAEEISVDSIENVVLAEATRPAALGRVKSVRECEIHGGVRLALREDATVSQTTFVPDTDATVRNPVLSAAAGAFLLDVTGTVDLGTAPGIHISAGADALTIGIHSSIEEDSDPWRGAMMTNVKLPPGLVGRRMLDKLQGAYQLTPDVSELPGSDQTAVARLASLTRRTPPTLLARSPRLTRLARTKRTDYATDADARRKLYEDAEFVRELASLSREKGTPGSVATRIAWCSYRLRNIKAHGVERAALNVYRLLGYGERPLPAFLLWAALSIALAGPVLIARGGHPEWCCFDRLLAEAGRLALGPLAGLLRGGTLSGGDIAEIAARTLTAIPLVTGALALRNYVKSER